MKQWYVGGKEKRNGDVFLSPRRVVDKVRYLHSKVSAECFLSLTFCMYDFQRDDRQQVLHCLK